MKFKIGDSVQHITNPESKFLIVACIQIETTAGVENKYLARQYHTKNSPHWPGLSNSPIELTEMELAQNG